MFGVCLYICVYIYIYTPVFKNIATLKICMKYIDISFVLFSKSVPFLKRVYTRFKKGTLFENKTKDISIYFIHIFNVAMFLKTGVYIYIYTQMYKQTPNMIRKEIYICEKFWSSPCRIQQISKLFLHGFLTINCCELWSENCSKLLINQYYLFLFRLIQAFLNTKQKRNSEWFYLRNHFWSWTISSSWLSDLLSLNLK